MKKLLKYLNEYRRETILGPLFKLLEALQLRRLGHPSHRQHWQIRSFPSTMGRV